MKRIEITKSGKNFTAVNVGQLSDVKNYELHMGPNVTIPGKVFIGQASYPQEPRRTLLHPQRNRRISG